MKLKISTPSIGRMKKSGSMSIKDRAHTPACPSSTKTTVRKGKKGKEISVLKT